MPLIRPEIMWLHGHIQTLEATGLNHMPPGGLRPGRGLTSVPWHLLEKRRIHPMEKVKIGGPSRWAQSPGGMTPDLYQFFALMWN